MKAQSRSNGIFNCRKFISLLLIEINKRHQHLQNTVEDPASFFLSEIQACLNRFQDKELSRALALSNSKDFKNEVLSLLIGAMHDRQVKFVKGKQLFLEQDELSKSQKRARRKILNAEARRKLERHPENWGYARGFSQGGAPGLGKRK
jgi:hypothetical protein